MKNFKNLHSKDWCQDSIVASAVVRPTNRWVLLYFATHGPWPYKSQIPEIDGCDGIRNTRPNDNTGSCISHTKLFKSVRMPVNVLNLYSQLLSSYHFFWFVRCKSQKFFHFKIGINVFFLLLFLKALSMLQCAN